MLKKTRRCTGFRGIKVNYYNHHQHTLVRTNTLECRLGLNACALSAHRIRRQHSPDASTCGCWPLADFSSTSAAASRLAFFFGSSFSSADDVNDDDVNDDDVGPLGPGVGPDKLNDGDC